MSATDILNSVVSAFGVDGAVTHALHLLQTKGEVALDAVRTAVQAIQAARAGNYAAIFGALDRERADVQEVIAAIKAEFGLQ